MSEERGQFSRELRLREEAESPFRKIRFLGYSALIAGAFISLAVSVARVGNGLTGGNKDYFDQSITNIGVDLVGIIFLSFFFRRDLAVQNSHLKRAAKVAEFAKLMVRGNFNEEIGKRNSVFPLSFFRMGRGFDKRIIIIAAGKEKIAEVLKQAQSLSDSLISCDLLIVPLVMPLGIAPLGVDQKLLSEKCIALPAGGSWGSIIGDEAKEAIEQGVDVDNDGICIVLKKNGKVGQRTKGIFLAKMCGEVVKREEAGMDVKNI